jgi:hypothetical protein
VCELYAFGELQNCALWRWYDQLIARQQAGLEGRVDTIMGVLSDVMVRAFMVFRRDLLAGLEAGDGNG